MILLIKKLLALVLAAAWKILRELLLRWARHELRALISVVWFALILLILLLAGKACG